MLKRLEIKDFAIIDGLSLSFGGGLNVLTGETGAGKSIIIEALGLVAGDKASADAVRSGKEAASVTAEFDGADLPETVREKYKISGDLFLVERSIFANGRSKASIGGVGVSLADLKCIGPLLVEISSQHEHQKLLDESTHLEIVDRFGCLAPQKEKFTAIFGEYFATKEKLAEAERLSATATEQREFLKFQIGEINRACLKEGDEESLDREKNIIRHGAKLLEKAQSSYDLLYSGEQSVLSAVAVIKENLNSITQFDPSIENWVELCDTAEAALSEVSRKLEGYVGAIEVDPSRLDDIESRLYEISRLKKKYGGSVAEILNKRDLLAEKLDLIDNCDDEIKRLSDLLGELFSKMSSSAEKLSHARITAAEAMSEKIQKELESLGLKKTTFVSGHIKLKCADADATGIDRFGFLISPNVGEPLKPMSRIASGGELSRIMLAIKNVLMGSGTQAAVEVFDEVDSGIGGAIAEMVGKKLGKMAVGRQVIAITHLPQVASFGDAHIQVSKRVVQGRTVTRFELLSEDGRVGEISRMLGGAKITETTKSHAREMLSKNG